MNILFGFPLRNDWKYSIEKLPYNIYFNQFNKIDNLLDEIKQFNIDIIIPCTYSQMYFTIHHMKVLSKNVKKIICNDNENTINLLDDKYIFYNYMTKNNYIDYIPQNYITKYNGNINNIKNIEFPCIYKLTKIYGSISSFVLKDSNDISRIKDSNDNYIIQEYIEYPGEYGGHFYVLNGKIIYYAYYYFSNDTKNYIRHGKMITYTKINDNICLDIFSKIFCGLNYTGFACIDFKLINGIPKIFEINPRFGGTIMSNEKDFQEIIFSCIEN